MHPQIAEAIAPLIALLGIGTFTLIGLRMYLGHKARQIRADAAEGAEGTQQLLAEMRDEVHRLRSEVGELAERVDFAERLLARGREPEA